jgi:hypothetical protein
VLALLPHAYGSPERHTYWGGYPVWEMMPYIGILPLLLTLSAFFVARNRYVWYFAAAGLFALLFSMGEATFVFRQLGQLPGFSAFRFPARMITQVLPCVVVLSAFAWDGLFANPARRAGWRRIITVVIALVLALLAAKIFLGNAAHESDVIKSMREEIQRRYDQSPVGVQAPWYKEALGDVGGAFAGVQRDALVATAVCAASALLFGLAGFGGWLRSACGLIALALIVGDLALFGMPFINTLPVDDPRVYPAHTPLLDNFAEDKSFFRVCDFSPGIKYHQLRRDNYNVTGGDIDSSRLNYHIDFIARSDTETNDLVNVMNVKYFISRLPMEEYRARQMEASPILKNRPSPYGRSTPAGDMYVTENARYFPRAFVVGKVVSMKGETQEDMLLLVSSHKNLKDTAMIEEAPAFDLNRPGEFQPAEITDYRANRLTVEADLAKPGFLVLSEMWYPDWHAYDIRDGGRTELHVYKTDYIMRGVFLDSGKHKVEFVYEPRAYYAGLIITLGALPVVLALLVVFGVPALRGMRRAAPGGIAGGH